MYKVVTLLLMLSVAGFATGKAKMANQEVNKPGQVTINVPTVQCNHCVETITTALDKVDGVKSVKIDLQKKTAFVKFADKKTNVVTIRQAIATAGYDADDIKRDETAHGKLPTCCQSAR